MEFDMIIYEKSLGWYVDKLKNGEYFSLGMYGDGEWIGVFRDNIGGTNAEGTLYTPELCDRLGESLNFKSENFLFSTPSGLSYVGLDKRIEKYILAHNLEIEFYEKNVWNTEAREARLAPLIHQLRQMNVILISNNALRGLTFLKYDHFIEVGYPNCFEEGERVKKEILEYGKPGVYLFSCGLPSTLFVQSVHGLIERSWFIQVGSIWDAFVGIGAQRKWRELLYENTEALETWKNRNLIYGTEDFRNN